MISIFFFFKQKTAYEMRISDWSSDVCSSDLNATAEGLPLATALGFVPFTTIRQHQGLSPTMPLAELKPGERVRPMGATDDMVPGLYSRALGMDRDAFFERLARDSQAVVLSRDHEPVGCALLRRFGRGDRKSTRLNSSH